MATRFGDGCSLACCRSAATSGESIHKFRSDGDGDGDELKRATAIIVANIHEIDFAFACTAHTHNTRTNFAQHAHWRPPVVVVVASVTASETNLKICDRECALMRHAASRRANTEEAARVSRSECKQLR